jgi:hypothetical protein
MSKIEELKKQNPTLVIDVVGIIDQLFDKSKYTEMAVNLIKNKISNQNTHIDDIVNELTREYGFNKEDLKLKSNQEILNIFKVISDYFGYNNFNVIKKFIELNERKLIVNNDLTSYKTFDELELQMSLASLKLIDKEMEKQIQKLFESNEWLVIKPLSFLASKKYGASTKWCTTQENNPEYYLRYSRRGILIYCINKISGDKVAAFKNLDTSYEKETSFWNLIDQRIDSLESGLPYDVMNIIKDEFTNTKKSNWDILSDDEKNRQVLWLENEYMLNKSYEDEIPDLRPMPMVEEDIPRMEEEVGIPIINRRARIVPMRAPSFDDMPTQAG